MSPGPALTLRAGPDALRHIRAHGLRAEDVDILPGASGGAKWLAIGGLDRYLFGEFLQVRRERPLHLIGSSIGSWRMACLAQHDPLAALARGHRGYIYHQNYSPRPDSAEVSTVLARILDELLTNDGPSEILGHPAFRLHVIVAEGKGLASLEHRLALGAGLAVTAAGNLVHRRALASHFKRVIFHSAGSDTPFADLSDFPTAHAELTVGNLRDVLLASGSIPLLMEGVHIPGAGRGVYWDGGVVDYHLDIDFGAGEGIVLYPHFYDHIVPGWFDKSLPWRRAGARNFRRVLLVAPSREFVRSVPGGRIPDRQDFYKLSHEARMTRWQGVLDASEQLGTELRELVVSGNVASCVEPW